MKKIKDSFYFWATSFVVIFGVLLSILWTLTSIFLFLAAFSFYERSIVFALFFQATTFLGLYIPLIIISETIKFLRTVTVFKEGIVVKYPFNKRTLINWVDIKEVSIGYYHGNGRVGDNPKACVYFIKNGETRGSDGRWMLNNPFHIFRVFAFPYSNDFYIELKEKCPIIIIDQRNTLLYREYWEKDKNK